MNKNKNRRVLPILMTLAILFSMFSAAVMAAPAAAIPLASTTITILHTNDFHGQLESSGSNPGIARVAQVVNDIRTAVGAANVLLVDAGDALQGSLLSNMGDGTATGKGLPTVAAFNAMGYNMATFGNHEFDWGQANLAARVTQATYPYVSANVVVNNTGNCATAGWTRPSFVDAPYSIVTAGTAPDNLVKVAFIGVTTTETPTITVSTATAGLCFKDPADSILFYYDAMKTAGADVIVVLSHLGYADGGYGYGIPVYGDQTLAAKLNTAGKPVNLIIGGHSHSNLSAATVVGNTTIAQAYYNGRTVGRADVTVTSTGAVSVVWSRTTSFTGGAQDATLAALVTGYATDPAYLAIVNQPIGYSAVDLTRCNYAATICSGNADNMMGTFIDDAIYNYLNTDGTSANDVDIFFNNAGGIRADWCWNGSDWVGTGCTAGLHAPGLLTYGDMFTVLPFGNATVVGTMTGAQILEVLHFGPNVAGVIQPAGLKYSYFKYTDGSVVYAWGAYDVCVVNKVSHACEPLDLTAEYRVGTNEFLAPAGGDGYNAFKYMTDITYWGDMLNAVNSYVSANYGSPANAYTGPNGNGTLDGRITLNGDGDTTFDGGSEIVPVTILHHNDSHGNLYKNVISPTTTYVGYTQLVTLINQERARNPSRTLLLSSGDNIQGDAMMYYFKSAPTGYASDGTPLAPALQMNPLIKAFNSMNYDAMVLGNHEFNFGNAVFTSVLSQATFPLLQANVTDDGSYGLAAANIQPYIEKVIGGDINIAIMGIGNPRVPNYELPSNIPGLTFTNPITTAQELSALLRPNNDVVIALTHIGFTENPANVEIDANVDTTLAGVTSGLDAIIGGHSHTNPACSLPTSGCGTYKFLPSIVADPDGNPVVIGQAYRYNNTLGIVVMGLRPLGGGNYDVVSQTGRYLTVVAATIENPAVKAIVDPYVTVINAYNNTEIGHTTAPIDALQAFTTETNAANLQADAAMYELASHGIQADFLLSGAMTNRKVADSATPASPFTLKISDMFSLMPYENSLVVISMNGPQLKTVLERAYRNYYYYKYVANAGGYSYYTTCMLATNFGNQITYNDLYPAMPNGNNVVSLTIGGEAVNFTNTTEYYNVATVNYLAAGSCNNNNAGVSIWPLDQIVADTQYYVRDAVINYITHEHIVSPAIEGRLQFVSIPVDTCQVNPGEVVINEVFPAPSGDAPEWIELYNTTDYPVDISSCYIDDGGANVTAPALIPEVGVPYLIPAGTIIPAHGFWTWDTFNSFDNLGDEVRFLKNDLFTVLDSLLYGPTPFDASWYRDPDGAFWATIPTDLPTKGFTNVVESATTFIDVPVTYWAYSWIERLYAAGITTGCSVYPLAYCPEAPVTRAEMAAFLERGMNGAGFVPPAGTGTVFSDVPLSHWAVDWIEEFYADGITDGCGTSPLRYCPENNVTRAQMAIFLLRAIHGDTYTPPAATGIFADVPTTYWAARWIEQLYAEGITSGCGTAPLTYCPENPVTRAEMAKFLVLTFDLP